MNPKRIDDLFEQLEQAGKDRRLPPLDRWHPEREGEIDIRIAADGTWFHEGGAFRRPALVRLLASVLRREGDGYFLVSPHEKLRITVEDAPLLATDCEQRGEGRHGELLFSTNGGDHVVADAAHAVFMRNGRPYVQVRDGLDALIVRSVFYRLVDSCELDEAGARLWSRGQCFQLDEEGQRTPPRP